MKEKRRAIPSKPSAGTSRGRKTRVTETKESGRAVVLPTQADLFASVSGLIEDARRTLARQANSTTVFFVLAHRTTGQQRNPLPPARGVWAEVSGDAGDTIGRQLDAASRRETYAA